MLSEKLGTEHGHVTGRRVLPGEEFAYMKLEMSFETEVEIMGVKGQNIGTYTIRERGPGQMYADGQGIIMTETGDGLIWHGFGIGQGDADGTIRVAASISIQTGSEKLSALNHQVILVEHHAHPDGNLHSDLYGWTTPAH